MNYSKIDIGIFEDNVKKRTNVDQVALFLFQYFCLYLTNGNWILYILDYINYCVVDEVL